MPHNVLVTGGEGKLAQALVRLDPSIDAPPKARLDVSRYESIEAYCRAHPAEVIIHAGAVTNRFDEDVDEAYIRTNIMGTANVVLWCMRHAVRLVYLSTDYVYPGQRGDYSEESVLLPVNRYAKSKLGGEMAVQLYEQALIIRTSFYETMNFAKACTDQFTSRLSLEEAAKAVYHLAVKTQARGIVNVGVPAKRSVADIVKAEFNPSVEACTRAAFHLPYPLPPDSSLNSGKWQAIANGGAQPSLARRTCRICGSGRLWRYVELGATPLANAYLKEEELETNEFTEELAVQLCESCGLSQLSKVVDPDRMFRHYLYASSTPATFRQHCAELAATVTAHAHAQPGDWVLDIASNDGCLLSAFQARGMNVVGVDPAENLVQEANAAGVQTLCAYWSPAVAKDIVSRFAPPAIITSTNVLAHVDDVHGFVNAVDQCLAPRGLWIIECPYVLDLIERSEFDTVYHEHLSYLSVHAIAALVERHRLQVVHVEYFPDLHGGTIRVYVARSQDAAVTPAVEAFLHRERTFGITARGPYEAFAQRVRRSKDALTALLARLHREGKTVWAYGASAKGNTLMNSFGIGRDLVPMAIDDNPRKWGWYTPGSHMRIVGIEELATHPVDALLLLAWNFKREIIERCEQAGYQGGFIIPVPLAEQLEPMSSVQRERKQVSKR